MMSASKSTPTLISWLVFNPSGGALHGTGRGMWGGYTAAVVRLRELAPYLAMLFLPGGSLMALLLWLYRRQKRGNEPSYAHSMLS